MKTKDTEDSALGIPMESIEAELLLDEFGNTRRPDPKSGAATGPRALQFRRFRQKDGGRRLAGFFRIKFPHEVPGPLALDYSSRFGMGLFLPVIRY